MSFFINFFINFLIIRKTSLLRAQAFASVLVLMLGTVIANNDLHAKGMNVSLSEYLSKLQVVSNFTEASAYKDQSAGFYTGGSVYIRNRVHNTQLAGIRMPSYRAGCGGIDFHTGAFSHIKGEQIVDMLRSIGSAAASYGMLMALETISPQIKNIVSELNDLAQKINQSNINSCEVAATTLGALLPQSQVANSQLCNMIGTEGKYGEFSDYAAAKQACNAGGKRGDVFNQAKNDERYKKMLGDEFNIAWKALQENAFLREDPELAEFFMSITGTIIVRQDGGENQIVIKPSLADNAGLLNALLLGGSVSTYKCEDGRDASKCLILGNADKTILPGAGFVEKIRNILLAIQDKIYQDLPLNDTEKAFINSTRIPFYKMLNVSTAFKRGTSPLDVAEYAELAALDVLYQYIMEVLDLMEESIAHLRSAQVNDAHIAQFQKELQIARARVNERRMGSIQQIEKAMALINNTQLIEKWVAQKLGTVAAAAI